MKIDDPITFKIFLNDGLKFESLFQHSSIKLMKGYEIIHFVNGRSPFIAFIKIK